MQTKLDTRRVQEFGRRLFGHYTSGLLTLMVDLGQRTGLFEAAAAGPATSAELATRAGLQERYVREWLGAVTTGGIMEYDPASGHYSLPAEHAACLTGASSRNLAPGSQVLHMLARRLPLVLECFHNGGGVPYEAYQPDFTAAQDASWRRLYDGLLVRAFLPAASEVPDRLRAGIRVADVGCGTGHAVNLMAREYARSSFVGFDLSEEAITLARAEARAMQLPNAAFEVVDVEQLPAEPPFDLITSFDAIHDQRQPAVVLRRIAEALAPGGVYLMLEPRASSRIEDNVANPFTAYMYGMSVLHCLAVSLAHDGAGLGTAWGEQLACRMLREAGFSSVEVVPTPGPQNNVFVCRREPARG